MGVVKDFKMVDVHHEQRKFFSVPGSPLHLFSQALLKFFMIVKAGETVGHRHPLRFFQKSRVLDRQSRMNRQGEKSVDILLCKTFFFVQYGQHTDDLSFTNEWEAEQLLNQRLMSRRRIPQGISLQAIKQTRLALGIGQSEQSAPGDGPLHRLRINFKPRGGNRLHISIQVEQRQKGRFRMNQLLGSLNQLVRQRCHLSFGRGGERNFIQSAGA